MMRVHTAIMKDGPGEIPALRVSAIVLAAGLSSRMDLGPKLLLDVDGEPMIRRTVRNVLEIGPSETIVVTGHRAAEVEAALIGLPIACVRNPAYRDGQPFSVALGIRSLREPCDAVMVMLGDQPLVMPRHLRTLITTFGTLRDRSILVPHHQGVRGNPIVLAAKHIPAVAGGELNLGCRKLIESQPHEVAAIEFGENVFTTDCDTPQDYERLIATARSSSAPSVT